MAQILYFSLLVIALCSLSEGIQRRYHYINMTTTWTEAQKYCRENYTDLATVNNINDMNELKKTVNNKPKYVWIGLKRTDVYNWRWSLGDPVKYLNWETEPSNDTNNCAFMRNGKWHRQMCKGNLGFICYNDELILIQKNLSWTEAVRYCRENHVDLVSVDSEKIQLWVTSVVHQAWTAEVWLGLRHSCSVGIWFWVNGEIVCYDHWALGNETDVDDCEREVRSGAVQSGGDHKWISLPESHKLNFICRRKEK
ncbi:secretory phospholipase A2 receptor-like [Triplophysa dalaica]|uniref:secretory phospholipase A2 receptor-like n=1 Tax=Triplophysa dalaica TaxID=1582913 RepID=UPI0024DFD738|nr:secretory phospholipase A2 receptor-like [Triplophysa dalaica]